LDIDTSFISHDENLNAEELFFRAENGGTKSQEFILHSARQDGMEITRHGEAVSCQLSAASRVPHVSRLLRDVRLFARQKGVRGKGTAEEAAEKRAFRTTAPEGVID
jgi:hypothetical protein